VRGRGWVAQVSSLEERGWIAQVSSLEDLEGRSPRGMGPLGPAAERAARPGAPPPPPPPPRGHAGGEPVTLQAHVAAGGAGGARDATLGGDAGGDRYGENGSNGGWGRGAGAGAGAGGARQDQLIADLRLRVEDLQAGPAPPRAARRPEAGRCLFGDGALVLRRDRGWRVWGDWGGALVAGADGGRGRGGRRGSLRQRGGCSRS
jgi:hypothetical protein